MNWRNPNVWQKLRKIGKRDRNELHVNGARKMFLWRRLLEGWIMNHKDGMAA